MSAFTYPSGYSNLLKDINRRLEWYLDDRRKGLTYPNFYADSHTVIKE